MDKLWVLLCTGLVFLMQAGFMCLESGLTRSKNSINVAVKNFADFGISVLLFWAFGYGIMFGASQGSWFGGDNFFFSADTQGDMTVFFLFQAMFCGTATTIISGAIAERIKFLAYTIVVILVSGLIYPFYGHWVWNSSGWLKQLGFIDFAGSTVVHGIGAWVGFATLIIIGSRQGRFSDKGEVNKIQGSNLPFAVLGALFLWLGWLGFNGGSTFAFNNQVPKIILNTVLAGVGGMIMAMIFSQVKEKRVEVEELINGSISGLVAITAGCHIIPNPLAIIVGITGAAMAKFVSQALIRAKIDDAVDAVAVHGGAGLWGTISVALFGDLALMKMPISRIELLLIQLLGIVIAMVWAFGLTWLILKPLNQIFPLRVSLEAEELGLNVAEHEAKTDTYELLNVMDLQAKTHDLTLRVPVESFTEVGHIATRYNQVMDALEQNHRQNMESLEELYAVTATAVSAVENKQFSPDDFDAFCDRPDELGILAQALQEMITIINNQQEQLQVLSGETPENHNQEIRILQDTVVEILTTRFGQITSQLNVSIHKIKNLSEIADLLKKAISAKSIDDFL
ncbi:ammonium transporter [Cyanobacterium aponinum UTEX 3221]|uniref:ammonium transporter n=1 Tax=Cyanobacterium aponinum TaxID=379064 RepID=UPI002B4BB658|nr:ammonium transporter [Cyanobacterium aponinum]WRL39495.1 ammonium transporter [Cyanobacterium aponinum UTEX 3221]